MGFIPKHPIHSKMFENKKVKTYYCDKLFGKDICGEKDPSKFETGRFSTCKKCRNKRNTDYYKLKKNEEKDNKVNDIDTDYKIRTIVEDCILRSPYINGDSIKDKFDLLDQADSEMIVSISDKIEDSSDKIRKEFFEIILKIQKENMELRKEIDFLKSKLL